MTEKLLTKPPFRYLHDIFTALNAATGFGNGLYQGQELEAKSITEKDAKINFLVKMIRLTELIMQQEIDVKPSKIVAGHEPEKTNLFLQAMAQAATAGIDTAPYVAQVIGMTGGEDVDDGNAAAAAEEQAAAEAAAAAEREAQMQAQKQEEERARKEKERLKKEKAKEAERRRKEEER